MLVVYMSGQILGNSWTMTKSKQIFFYRIASLIHVIIPAEKITLKLELK